MNGRMLIVTAISVTDLNVGTGKDDCTNQLVASLILTTVLSDLHVCDLHPPLERKLTSLSKLPERPCTDGRSSFSIP